MSEDHVIHLGDCLDPLTGLASLADKSVDHVICDPPYSRDLYLSFRTNKGRPDLAHRNRDTARQLASNRIGAIDDILAPVSAEMIRATRRWMIVFCDVEISHLWREAFGELYVRTGVWVKTDPTPQISGDRPAQGFETAIIAHAAGRKRWNGGGRAATWVMGRDQGPDRPEHPCPKPPALMQELVADFTDPGELICDPFAGSGTTLVAAKRLGRRAIGWEKDATFWERAVRRLENTRQQYELLPRGPKPKQQKMVLP